MPLEGGEYLRLCGTLPQFDIVRSPDPASEDGAIRRKRHRLDRACMALRRVAVFVRVATSHSLIVSESFSSMTARVVASGDSGT